MRREKFTLRSAVYLLLVKNDNVLLLRRFKTGWEDGKYTLISGHLEGGEKVKEAMIREAREEAGIIIRKEDLNLAHVMHRKSTSNHEYIDFFLTVRGWKGEPSIREPDKSDDMRWFSIKSLPQKTLPHVKQAIEFCRKNVPFSEVGFR